MKVKFTKMQGCGNDYIYINCFDNAATSGVPIQSPESLSVLLSNRHYGVGGDGLVLILPSAVADAKMRMFNLDGSEGKMCGNAIRCVGKYLYENGIVRKAQMIIETLSGIKQLRLFCREGIVSSAEVNMGRAELHLSKIPVALPGDRAVARKTAIGGREYKITCVSMGNPHCVVFWESIDNLDLPKIGPLFESAPIFPHRVNTEFVELVGKNYIRMRVWERGSGETLACGTGACAAAVAAVLGGYCEKDREIRVGLLGGELTIRYTDGVVFMTGECKKVFEGVAEVEEQRT